MAILSENARRSRGPIGPHVLNVGRGLFDGATPCRRLQSSMCCIGTPPSGVVKPRPAVTNAATKCGAPLMAALYVAIAIAEMPDMPTLPFDHGCLAIHSIVS